MGRPYQEWAGGFQKLANLNSSEHRARETVSIAGVRADHEKTEREPEKDPSSQGEGGSTSRDMAVRVPPASSVELEVNASSLLQGLCGRETPV